MGTLLKINGYIKKFEEFTLSFSVIFMAAVLVANVFGRLFFQRSLTFAEEVCSLIGAVVMTFIGVSYVVRVGRHIMMSVIYDMLGHRGKKLFMFIVSAVTGILLLYLSYISFLYVLKIFGTGRYTPVLQIPMWIPYITIPLGFLLAALQYVSIFCLNLRDKDRVYTCIDPIDDLSVNLAAEESESKW